MVQSRFGGQVMELKSALYCVGLFSLACSAAARPEPNAFLNKVAPDIKAIVKQIETDPAVRARYIAHYGMSKGEIVSYLSSLKPSRITKSGPYVVYNVRDDGVVRSRVFNLKAGSLVYIDSVGRPVMKKVCGNPMTKGPANLSAVNLIHDLPVGPPMSLRPTEETAPQAESPSELMVAEELAAPPVETIPEVTPPITTPPAVVPEVKPSFEVGDLGGSFLPLLSGGLIGLFGNGGGGNNVIPEPASIAAFAGLFGAYSLARRRNRK